MLRLSFLTLLTLSTFACGPKGDSYTLPSASSDADGDGVADNEDRCLGQAEDRDNHRDWDGCPDDNDSENGGYGKVPEAPPPAASYDRDGDGILDDGDKCPDEPEDMDGFEDANGCPDADNDGDGVADASDACPNQPETKNGFDDTDGCPDATPDPDGDGITGSADKCPSVAEDRDSFEDTDGCPDLDNDGDGVLDQADQCRNQPETINGYKDGDGCPDK